MKTIALAIALLLPAVAIAGPAEDAAVRVQIEIAKVRHNAPGCGAGLTTPLFQQHGGSTERAKPATSTAAAPALTEDDLPADQKPTPMTGVVAALRVLAPRPDEVLVDYGCGFDARFLITAVRRYGVLKAIGVEIDPAVAASARRYVDHAGLSDRITIITGDATTTNVQADIGVAYLWPDTLTELRPRISKLKRFVSYNHQIPGVPPRGFLCPGGTVYLWTKPAPVVQLAAPAHKPMAVYRGKLYGGPVCNNPGCSMCAAIRRQLAASRAQVSQQGGHYEKRCYRDASGRKVCTRVWVPN